MEALRQKIQRTLHLPIHMASGKGQEAGEGLEGFARSSETGHKQVWEVSQVTKVHACAFVLSQAQLFVTPWTIAYQAPLSVGFSRQEYWNG